VVGTSVAKFKTYKSLGCNQNPAELIEVGSKISLRSINPSFILFGIRSNYLISGRSLLLYQSIRMATKMAILMQNISIILLSRLRP
jgi:hypothetical protein